MLALPFLTLPRAKLYFFVIPHSLSSLLSIGYVIIVIMQVKIADGKHQFRVERNPLLAEKTPRHPVFGNWDFSPIPARPEFENLNYQVT